ncbi:MAG: putative transcriptional regulator [Acidimicrobiia bacterium]|nr:putative transcriptional regulator [Acidimicrobiia bacterium]
MLELAILGLLREQELHGYELKKRISELGGNRLAISFGSLYPALARLEALGSVKAVEAHEAPIAMPMTGSLAGEAAAFLRKRRPPAERTGRARKVYGITEQGEQHLHDLLTDPTLDDKAFHIKVAFCRYLPPAGRLELFERRRAQLTGQLAGAHANPRRRGELLDSYLRSLREHDTESTQHDIAWLDRLIASERAATVQAQEEQP